MVNIKFDKYKGLSIKIFNTGNNANKIFVAIHGFAGDKESSVISNLGENLLKKDYVTITYDLPYHGESYNDKPIALTECIDSISVINEYINKNFKYSKKVYFATSFGAFILLNYLQNNIDDYYKIILRAPALKMDEILINKIIPEHGYTINDFKGKNLNLGYNQELIVNYKFYSDLKNNNIKSLGKKLYVIQGKKDNIVDYKQNEKIFDELNYGNTKFYYINNADHRFKNPGELEEIIKIVNNILG